MTYLCKDERIKETLLDYINRYVREHLRSPSIREIAEGTGISRATVQRYMAAMRERGEIDYGRRNVSTPETKRIEDAHTVAPLFGTVSCGIPKEPLADGLEYVPLPRRIFGEGELFVVTASGDSMTDAGIDDGDLIVVRRQDTAEDGEIAVVLVDGTETTLKRFYRIPEEKAYRLHAENRSYPPSLRDRTVKNAEIQGVAVRVIKILK